MPLFKAAEAQALGCGSALLGYYLKKGLIERLDRGVYRGKNTTLDVEIQYEDLVLAAKSVPSGIICLVSALALYEYTEEIPRAYWIAVNHEEWAPRRKGVKIVRMRNTTCGLSKLKIGSETVSIFDREKTIIDAFRYLGKETAIKALKTALSPGQKEKIDINKLRRYAKALRVAIDPYLLAVNI
jgi:predicted transcriptional regulator of viral defense system